MQSFRSFITEHGDAPNAGGQITHSAKAEKKIQSTTGPEKAFRRFVSGDFRKNKTFGKSPSLSSGTTVNKVAGTNKIKPVIKPSVKLGNQVKNNNSVSNVPIPASRPVIKANASDTAAVAKKPVNQPIVNGVRPEGQQVKRQSSGALNMVRKGGMKYSGGIISGITSRKPAVSADDPKHSNAISADKARREPINADNYKGTPQAERDRADSFKGYRGSPEKKVITATPNVQSKDDPKSYSAKRAAGNLAAKRPSLGIIPKKQFATSPVDAKSSNAISADKARREPINADKYKGTPQAERDRADSKGSFKGTPDAQKMNSTPAVKKVPDTTNNEPINPDKYKGTPQAERDRNDSKQSYKPLEVSNAKRDQIKAAVASRRIAEEHKKNNSHKALLGGKGLELRHKIRDRMSNQKNSPSRYIVQEEEKKLGDTDTGEPGETIDVEPKKKELSGQER